MKEQKGITLIALVITIIVLLILAGVTIAMLTGNNSAPEKAREASLRDAVAGGKDAVTLKATAAITDFYDAKYVPGTTATTSYANASAAVLGQTYEAANVQITISSNTIKVKSTKDATYGAKGVVDSTNGSITWTDYFGNYED